MPLRLIAMVVLLAAGRLLCHAPYAFEPGNRVLASGKAVESHRSRSPVFIDVTEEAGITFTHVRGASGSKYMVETFGSGAAFFDYDEDGLLDLYLVNGAPLPGFSADTQPINVLYRNNGDGSFSDVTAEAGVGDPGYGGGCAVGDYDNDGFLDLYVTNFGPDVLFHNNGDGTFSNVTRQAGLGCELWGTSSAFGDIDGDGDLDLYVANYVDFSFDNHKKCINPATRQQNYCHPDVYNGLPDVLYRNNGDGTFTDITEPAGAYSTAGKGLGVVFGDYDNDRDLDIYVANDSTRNFLWQNQGDGTFEEVALLHGVAFSEEGVAEGGMGVDFGDYNSDGRLDIFVTNFDFETNTLYRNTVTGFFSDVTFPSGMGQPSLSYVGFGTGFFDYDNDGDLDVFVANGHIVEDPAGDVSYRQPNLLLRNDGQEKFEDVSRHSGAPFETRQVSRGTAFGDYDNDGDFDILVTNSNDSPNLLRNMGGNDNHKLMVRVLGTRSNRDGLGARLVVMPGEARRLREVHGASSYCSHNDLRILFGLGAARDAGSLEIHWPSGLVQTFPHPSPDELIIVKEGQGIIQRIPLVGPRASPFSREK